MASGICGTDIHIFNGEYLGAYPVIPGHEFSGVVVSTGSQITRFKVGDRVAVEPNIACDNCVHCLNNRQNFCLNWQALGVTLPGGMEQYVTAPEKAAFSIGDLPFEVGAFVEPLSCVVHGIERVRLRLADQVAILGAGPIGNLILQMARLQGAAQISVLETTRVGRNWRVKWELILLTNWRICSRTPSMWSSMPPGVLPVMNRAIDFVRPGGTVLLFGVPPAGRNLEVEALKCFRKV